VLGSCKTRLAESLGDDDTFLLYQALLADTARKLDALPKTVPLGILAFPDGRTVPPTDPLGGNPFRRFRMVRQPDLPFGDRLAAAMRWPLANGFSPSILVSADSPELRNEDLLAAFDKLSTHDIVLGPAEDGGYYLIGMNRFHPALFKGITWSTSTVAGETVAATRSLGLSFALVGRCHDVDFLDDLVDLARRRSAARDSLCPATDAWLAGTLPGQTRRRIGPNGEVLS
jgi:rSAM/selenodomain-associated transferase 1